LGGFKLLTGTEPVPGGKTWEWEITAHEVWKKNLSAPFANGKVRRWANGVQWPGYRVPEGYQEDLAPQKKIRAKEDGGKLLSIVMGVDLWVQGRKKGIRKGRGVGDHTLMAFN